MMRPSGRLRRVAATGATFVLALVALPNTAGAAGPQPLNVSVTGTTGTGVIDRPGRSCAEGGYGAHFHYGYASPLPAGAFTKLVPGDLRLQLDLHSEAQGAGVAPQPSYTNGFLLGEESSAALSNERGTIRVALKSGSGTCATPNVNFNGEKVTGASGTWRVVEATGSYRQAVGTGAFAIPVANFGPGADNPFFVGLNGTLDVLDPALQVDVKDTYWGFLGADYATRRVTVVYTVQNVGLGDAYNVVLKNATSSTNGVTALGPKDQKLGDLAAGETEEIRVKYQLGLLQPCSLVILNCQFQSTLTIDAPDALDASNVFTKTKTTKAPALPPPVMS
jgi:hypothetical protein